MPTLFRMLITLIFLGGLVYAGMFALISFVDPSPKEVSQRVPTRELLGETTPGSNGGTGAGSMLPQPNVTSQSAAQ